LLVLFLNCQCQNLLRFKFFTYRQEPHPVPGV
jgi:hypothetical protein